MKVKFDGKWTVPGNSPTNYMAECGLIINDETKFSTFKTNKNAPYTFIVGMSTDGTQGKDFLQFVRDNDPDILNHINDIKRNDILGGPVLQKHNEVGLISGNTLQYMMSSTYIRRHFSKQDLGEIVEIGGGYGGLCTVLTSVSPYQSYTILDLPTPSLLQQLYLSKLDIKSTACIDTNNIPLGIEYDLCISEYCISEFDEVGIDFYINSVIKYCKGSYFLLNFNASNKLDNFIKKLETLYNDVELCQYPMTPELNGCRNGKYLICKDNKFLKSNE